MRSTMFVTTVSLLCLASGVTSQEPTTKEFVDYFSSCIMNTPEFDDCIRDALNDVRLFFKTGVPELGLPRFDPFFAKEVIQRRGIDGLNYILRLKNVRESGWTISMVTKFRSELSNNRLQYTQFFPEKYLEGEYEIQSRLINSTMSNSGVWNLTLYDLTQTTTITWPKGSRNLKVYVDVEKIGNLDLHISNLLRGRTALETILDRIINRMWQPGFSFIRPLINDLVSTGFTEIFTNAFRNLDIRTILPN